VTKTGSSEPSKAHIVARDFWNTSRSPCIEGGSGGKEDAVRSEDREYGKGV
jgi:hypothetical protein